MIAYDAITRLGSSTIQHGHYNDRIYVMRLARDDVPAIIRSLDDLAVSEGYSKIFAKVPDAEKGAFESGGYTTEATVPRYFNGRESALFMAKYYTARRQVMTHGSQIREVIAACGRRTIRRELLPLPPEITINGAEFTDADAIATLYETVFTTYPFPIFNPDFIHRTMEEQVRYFCAKRAGEIVAASSCEFDFDSQTVEMTDFATLPQYRGKGLAYHLLHAMEQEATWEQIPITYTIARAISHPINSIFSGSGYEYCGTLVNNTNICGSLESMNVWFKQLDLPASGETLVESGEVATEETT